jgi:SIR2-like domain
VRANDLEKHGLGPDSGSAISDHKRPGLRARTVQQLARDLMLARDMAPPAIGARPYPDIGEVQGRRGRAIFLIGAGCSVSAGIPLAADVAKRCACILARRYAPPKREAPSVENAEEALKSLTERDIVSARFANSTEEADWGALYKYFFSEHLKSPNQQREIISAVIGDREFDLNWAHACLGALVQRRYVHTVLTTNFDQLALQGIIRTGITPVVADGLESLMRISPSPVRPQVVHLHGSMHTYDLRNSPTALTETGEDRNFQTMMMSLLKQTTAVVVVGYAGGEEGVMSLLQYAAENIPRMVVYWVGYEKSYADFSGRTQLLLETGENKFFIPDQDADRFFQRLMQDLGEGQPDWVADPIKSLVEQGDRLRGGKNREIRDLISDFRNKTAYAMEKRRPEGDAVVGALQARSEGDFLGAIRLLKPIKDGVRRARKLYAQSLQDLFDRNPSDDPSLIDLAIEEYRRLFRFGRGVGRFYDAIALIEALLDKVAERPETSTEDPTEEILRSLLQVIGSARNAMSEPDENVTALLNFYEARAFQELRALGEKNEPDRSVIEAYEKAVLNLSALGEKANEARDGLAQALVTYSDAIADSKTDLAPDVRRQMREDITRAISIHRDLVNFAWYNQPSADFAARLENLASDFEVLAKVKRKGSFQEMPVREAVGAMERAVAAYELANDRERAAAAEARLAELSQRLT